MHTLTTCAGAGWTQINTHVPAGSACEDNAAAHTFAHTRFYTQTGAKYFRPYMAHELSEIYFTSDYDLSSFNSYKAGLGVRYVFLKPFLSNYSFNEIALRYAFYKRSYGLSAHMLALLLEAGHTRLHGRKKNR